MERSTGHDGQQGISATAVYTVYLLLYNRFENYCVAVDVHGPPSPGLLLSDFPRSSISAVRLQTSAPFHHTGLRQQASTSYVAPMASHGIRKRRPKRPARFAGSNAVSAPMYSSIVLVVSRSLSEARECSLNLQALAHTYKRHPAGLQQSPKAKSLLCEEAHLRDCR